MEVKLLEYQLYETEVLSVGDPHGGGTIRFTIVVVQLVGLLVVLEKVDVLVGINGLNMRLKCVN